MSKNKNQTAAERARARETAGVIPTTHECAAPNCPHPHDPILMKDLYPVVSVVPRRHTVFYHRACGPKIGGG